MTESLPPALLADGTAAANGRNSFTSGGRRPPSAGDAAAPAADASSSSSSSLQEQLGARGPAAAAAPGWVPRVPAGVEAHPGQVQLMQRCLRYVAFASVVIGWLCFCGRSRSEIDLVFLSSFFRHRSAARLPACLPLATGKLSITSPRGQDAVVHTCVRGVHPKFPYSTPRL